MSYCNRQILQNSECTLNSKIELSFFGNKQVESQLIKNIINSCGGYDDLSILLARQKINEFYTCLGYVNSGAILKKNENNSYSYQIMEGVISSKNINVIGVNKRIKTKIIRFLMDGQDKKVLNVNNIRHKLEVLKSYGAFKTINTTIKPLSLGKAGVDITVNTDAKTNWVLALDNQQSEATGATQLSISGDLNNLRNIFDQMGGGISISEGSRGINFYYNDSPSKKVSWGVSLDKKEVKVIKKPLDKLNIKSFSEKISFNYNYALYNSLVSFGSTSESEKFDMASKLELSKGENYLLDRGFSFSEGEQEGKSKITSLQTNLVWEKKKRSELTNYAISASFGVDIGLNAFNATPRSDYSAGSNYKILKANLAYRQTMTDYTNILLNLNIQKTNDNLLASKKFGLGGIGSVRGISKNIGSFNNGLSLTLESSTLLPQLSKTPLGVKSLYDGNFYGRLFADYAIGIDQSNKSKQAAGSIGIGTSWYLNKDIKLNTSWARPVYFEGFSAMQKDSVKSNRISFDFIVQGRN